MATEFTSATSVVAVPPSLPMERGVGQVLFTSGLITQGSQFRAVSISMTYEAILPDTDDSANTPFDFDVAVVLEVKQQDGTFEEIGRQNTGLRKLSQGVHRNIIVSPGSSNAEEGVDQFIMGIGVGAPPAKIKSRFQEGSEGDLRLKVIAVDNDPGGPNPFESVTFSLRGRRYDPA